MRLLKFIFPDFDHVAVFIFTLIFAGVSGVSVVIEGETLGVLAISGMFWLFFAGPIVVDILREAYGRRL